MVSQAFEGSGRLRRGLRRLRGSGAVLALIAVAGAAACEATLGPNDPVVGVYDLQTVNGQPLPVIVDEQPGFRRELVSGVISLNADGTFSDRLTTRETSSGAVIPRTDTIVGTYTVQDNLISFTAVADGSKWNGTLNGRNLTQIISGLTLVYRK